MRRDLNSKYLIFINSYMQKSVSTLFILGFLPLLVTMEAFYSSCVEDQNRVCPNSDNQTDFLLSMKKGGTDILSTEPYMYDFMLCEQYNYDCGYQEQSESYTTISNGIELQMNDTKLGEIFQGTNQTLEDKITPYLGTQGQEARCGMKLFPLTMSGDESKVFLDLYMNDLQGQVVTAYDTERDTLTTSTWSTLNINIRTGVLFMLKKYPSWIGSGELWNCVLRNDFIAVSTHIKTSYESTGSLEELHASYLIDSVTIECDKRQSINFLVDQSGSIGQTNFQTYVREFLQLYINTTNDDLGLSSLHFYNQTFQQFLGYGNDYNTFLDAIQNKPHLAGGTMTGAAINQTIIEIQKGNFMNGLPTVMAVMTDGISYDDVLLASDYARSFGIIMIAIGVGANVDDAQLLQIAQTSSNIVKIDSYDKIAEAVEFLFNYFCKQMITVNLGDSILGNYVKVPTSPSYFRVVKSLQGQYYELDIEYESDPVAHSEQTAESQIDPFPDQYTEYDNSENYQLYTKNPTALRSDFSFVGTTPKKVYFIEPSNIVQVNVKKNVYIDVNASISFVAIRGLGLGFNISLKNCTTLTCQQERALYRNQQSVFITLTPEDDLSIFIVIGSCLGALALFSVFLIFGIRRWEEEQKKKKQQEQQNTQSDLQNHIVPSATCQKISEKRSCRKSQRSRSKSRSRSSSCQKSSKSSKKSCKSSKSSKKSCKSSKKSSKSSRSSKSSHSSDSSDS